MRWFARNGRGWSWLLSVTALSSLGAACTVESEPAASDATAGKDNATAGGHQNDTGGGGAAGSATTAGASPSAGTNASAGAAAQGGGPTSTPSTCGDATLRGSLDLPNVGAAPTAISEADLKEGGSTVVHYFMSVPGNLPAAGTTDPKQQVGLFLTFHEHGGTAKDEIPSVTKSLANLKRAGDFVVLGMPIESGSHGYSTADHERAKKLLSHALATWPINPRRVYLWGRGEGATMAHQFGTENKAAIASMVTYSWGSERWPSNAANDQPDLYLVIGLADYPDSHVPLVRRVYQAAKKAQFDIIYREVPGLKGATGNAPTNDDAVAWAIATRHKTLPATPAEQGLLTELENAANSANICPDAAAFAPVALVGGGAASKAEVALLGAKLDSSRALAAELAAYGAFGEDAAKALAALLVDTSADVRKSALRSLGQLANWRSAAAQQALIAFATSTTADAAERALAVDAIGVAVKFQIGGGVDTGGYQDPPLFQALVTLLSDTDAALRGKAFTILKPARTSDYDAAQPPSAQQSAIAGWQSWVMTLKG